MAAGLGDGRVQIEGQGDMKDIVCCNDCGAPYGEDGWCDVVIPDEVWNALMPNGGLLCFRCMTKRLIAGGFDKVPVIVSSGPYTDANEEWRMIGWRHGYKVGSSEAATMTTGERIDEDIRKSKGIEPTSDDHLWG